MNRRRSLWRSLLQPCLCVSHPRGDFVGKAERYGIRIDSPQPIDQISSADLKVIGSYAVRPPAGALRLFTMTTPGAKLGQPQATVETFDEERKLWSAEIHLPNPPRYTVFIVAALVGASGAALWDYYEKVAGKGMAVPLGGPLPPDIVECHRIWMERV